MIENCSVVAAAIKKAGARWTARSAAAGSTTGSSAPVHSLGLISPDAYAREVSRARAINDRLDDGELIRESLRFRSLNNVQVAAATGAQAPASWDWRNVGARNYVTAVRDQGQCGSCVSFAVTALMESMVLVEHGIEADLSEADLFFCGGGSCADGWSPGDAISRIRSVIGIPSENVFPYPKPAAQTPCRIGTGRNSLAVRARHDVAFFNAKSRKNYLSSVGPMVACMDVYEDFNCYADGVYEHVIGEWLGGHCVLIIGYDDIQQCWIGKNSWGPFWGKQGFFRIRYGECGIDADIPILGWNAGNPFRGVSRISVPDRFRPTHFLGRFEESGRSSLLNYNRVTDEWTLSSFSPHRIRDAGNTAGFGNDIDDGRPFWVGDFTGDGRSDILFYYPGDDNWWLGTHNGKSMSWSLAGNTAGFGHGINDGRPFWVGDFTQAGKDSILFYYPGDGNWWLGTHNGNSLQWSNAGNTAGFGHDIHNGRPFWVGDFTGDGRSDILFYNPDDDNWWLGSHNGNSLQWSNAGNTAGFGHGIDDGRPFWVGSFAQAGKDSILFYYPGDDNWWLGTHNGNSLQWSHVGNTAGFGHGINDGRPFWVGDFTGDGRSDVLFYYPGDDNWWLGTFSGATMSWSLAGNTARFGHGIDDGRPFWVGDFTQAGKDSILFYYPGDQNWWLGTHNGNSLQWTLAGNTARTWKIN